MPAQTFNSNFLRWYLRRIIDDFSALKDDQVIIANTKNPFSDKETYDLTINLEEGICRFGKDETRPIKDYIALITDQSITDVETEMEIEFQHWVDEQDESFRHLYNFYHEDDHKIYSTGDDKRLIADFAIDIESIVKDDQKGQLFYVRIREYRKGVLLKTDPIEILPEALDHTRSFYASIRPHGALGEIIQRRNDSVKPLSLFKWLLHKFDKPVVRRPDHVGYIQPNNYDKRPFWLFGNALICPPFNDQEGKIVRENTAGEFIVDKTTGFTLPLYETKKEKEQLAPIINLETEGVEYDFIYTVRNKLVKLIGGGDPTGKAENYAKMLFGYVVYHLYERQLYHANDINGHTVMFYVHGPKGSGKTTYFNTFLRAFFGLHNTKELKGNRVSIPALENQMGMFSQMPVCYDEYNPEKADLDYQGINSYYHKTSRHVSDIDRKGRNKFTPIRSTLSHTVNYPIDLSVDQADATESRVIYFQYKKEYRSDDAELFGWFEDNLNELSRITTYLLLNQTDEKRHRIKQEVKELYNTFKDKLDERVKQAPKKYIAEHRLTDNYVRILACYEHVFGEDVDFRNWTFNELLSRFAAAKANQKDNALLSTLIYLASSGRVKESWHYNYNNSSNELYVNLSLLYESYQEFKRDKAMGKNQFKEILRNYFKECGGYETAPKKWNGSYYNGQERITVNKTIYSEILMYTQVAADNLLAQLFPFDDEEHGEYIHKEEKAFDDLKAPEKEQLELDEDAPF